MHGLNFPKEDKISTIKLYPIDEVWIGISCEESIRAEISDFFTFTPTKPVFNKGRRVKNPKIRLYKRRENKIYRGIIPYLEYFASTNGYTLECDPILLKTTNITIDEFNSFIDSMNLHSGGKPISPYEYQFMSAFQAIKNKRLLLLSPTGSGKSLICYLIIRFLVELYKKKDGKILIIVPTTNLVRQLFSDFQDYSSVNGWNVEKWCHKIYSGQEKYTDHKVIITTWQSLNNMNVETLGGAVAVVGDEAHTATAAILKNLLEASPNAKYRIGMTGTLDEIDVHQLILEGLFGPVYQSAKTHELIKEGYLSNFEIHTVILKHETKVKMDYHEEMDYLVSHEKRNRFIRNLAMDLKNNTLVLFRFVEKHGKILQQMATDANKEGKKSIYFIYGKTDKELIDEIRGIVEKENNAVIFASYQKFSIGSNIKNLHNIIFASPSKGKIRVMQSIGRGLRLNENKDIARLFDIADMIVYNDKSRNYTFSHLENRLRMYNEEKFPCKLYKVRI